MHSRSSTRILKGHIMDIFFLSVISLIVLALGRGVYKHHNAQGEDGTKLAAIMIGLCGVILVLFGLGSKDSGFNGWYAYGLGLVIIAAAIAAVGRLQVRHTHARSGRHTLR